jgi:hypothetical protein
LLRPDVQLNDCFLDLVEDGRDGHLLRNIQCLLFCASLSTPRDNAG